MEISLFDGMTSKNPIRGTIEGVVATVRQDQKLATFTQSYRLTGNKDFKHDAPLFAVAVVFKGGKGIANIEKRTQYSLVDLDHVFDSGDPAAILAALEQLKEKVCQDPHTLFCYITMSGNGLRIIYPYEGDDYPAAFAMGNNYYERLTGKMADPQCKNITRLSGLAYDPTAYYNPDAIAFTDEEIKAFHSCAIKKGQRQKKRERINAYYENIIKPKLEKDQIRYEPTKHNQYVMRVGYMMARKRYAQADATEWAKEKFAEYDGVEQVFKSCYDQYAQGKKASEGGGHEGGGSSGRSASVDEIKDFLDGHAHLRFNLISGRYECQLGGEWKVLTDRVVNTLWSTMSSTVRVSKLDLINVIESNYTPAFHPFREYLENLPSWHEGDKDYIRELALSVRVKGEDKAQELWRGYLEKWLVAMVAGWIDTEAVNNVILVFIGRQGAFKTTWFNYLLPPELRQYFYTKTNARRMAKDDLIALSQYALICCEELDTMTPSELNQLKAAVTMQYTNERAPYARYPEQRKHINSFCGTGNSPEFLNDPTGNRRWLPFEVERIISPREHPFCYQGIFGQAYALYKSGLRYWFTDEEIDEQNLHNRHFEAPRLEQELVDLYFRKPMEGETGEFVSVARAIQIISCNMGQKLSTVKVSKAFSDLGFKRVRTCHSRGFIACIRSAEEIRAYQISQGLNAEDG